MATHPLTSKERVVQTITIHESDIRQIAVVTIRSSTTLSVNVLDSSRNLDYFSELPVWQCIQACESVINALVYTDRDK